MTHELKIEKPWADAKLCGDKLFEIRYNDRGFQKGDYIRYTVIDDAHRMSPNKLPHPLTQCLFQITYVQWYKGLEPGYVVIGEVPVREKEE